MNSNLFLLIIVNICRDAQSPSPCRPSTSLRDVLINSARMDSGSAEIASWASRAIVKTARALCLGRQSHQHPSFGLKGFSGRAKLVLASSPPLSPSSLKSFLGENFFFFCSWCRKARLSSVILFLFKFLGAEGSHSLCEWYEKPFKSTLKWGKLCTKRRSLLVGGDIENHKRLWEVYRKVKRRKWPASVDRSIA